ncbi:hypothetical protein N7492_000727 [Penicillium capsulatum]|uniref:TPR repeat-containing protein n=1 Tax=Penicillium capsulatum TaxID=69766 RepID=A0A9W9ITC9_9EURO|nr:hypothetical protein N7492_000727 [Penicillium capsulatum]KAJ6130214.1 hypothetical protein N7512_002994 [Penicillium capsulatum]
MAESTYLKTLNSVFEAPLKDQFDPVRLVADDTIAAFELPIAKRVLGHDTDNETLSKAESTKLCYTTFVADNARAALQKPSADLTVEQTKSQLLHVGLAALFCFLQSNVTGPPLAFNSSQTILPSALRSDVNTLRAVRAKIIRDLSVDGEAAYKLTPNPELFSVAKALLVEASSDGALVTKTARLRVNFLHQKMLSEVTSTLQDAIYKDLDEMAGLELNSDDKGRFFLERAIINTYHGFDAKARADLDQASNVRHFEFALTGKLGKRTKFQDRDISQLVVVAKSADEDSRPTDPAGPAGPKNLDLNDDTLLESISFADQKATTVQEELSQDLQSVDINQQPILNPVDSAILLAMASAITNTAPENGLTREETQPYATRVLEGGSSNWQIYTEALLVRSRVEGFRPRTVERSVLQMQALVDQVIADTATDDSAAQQPSSEPTTFLPRPEKSESAPAADRLQYIWLMNFSTRWNLEAELAKRWVELGGLRTALDIYERLQMWAEASLCYAATERELKAKCMVRRQLFEATGGNEDDENEQFEGPERSELPGDAPRLFCILGDLEKDENMYERAWDISGQRYARAQRSLARHYLTSTPPNLEKAEESYKKSLHINRLNHSAWFALGCVQLELQRWEDAANSFTRAVQLDDTDGEAWSNLAAAIMRTPEPEPTPIAVDENSEEKIIPEQDPHKRKREALAALNRAAQLKNTDARIWDNVLTVAASIPPPVTPFRDVITAQRRLIELLGTKKGEKCIDLPILGMLVDVLVTAFDYQSLLIPSDDGLVIRTGTIPGQILSLVDDYVVPLITHNASLWLLVARIEVFRERPSLALASHEKAWRATIASCAQGAFQMGEKKPWQEVVRATERLVRDGYVRFGPMDLEGQQLEGDAEPQMIAKDWRFKSKSAVRGILGKGKTYWEDSDGWIQLKELLSEVTGN